MVASMLHIGPVEYGSYRRGRRSLRPGARGARAVVISAIEIELRKHIRRVGGPFDPSM